MRILIIGAGVVGTVYGSQLGVAGNAISVLEHGTRTEVIAATGLLARDVSDGTETCAPAEVIPDAGEGSFDLVVVALRHDQLDSAAIPLSALNGRPLIVYFGNNPSGRSDLPTGPDAAVTLSFPGIGGTMVDDVANYFKISQQPTALEATDDPRLADIAATLRSHGFAVQRVGEMDGWLLYHAVFVACVSGALYRCETDPLRLAGDRVELKLMCQAISEGFSALRADHVPGLPRNLAILHNRFLAPIAIRYWAHTMRTPMGELAFAAHSRHAETEMRALAHEVLLRVGDGERPDALHRLLAPSAGSGFSAGKLER
jgi:2-dehydropantoate 2-reductase